MKILSTVTLILLSAVGFSQTLPFDFEGGEGSVPFVDFDGGVATIEANPLAEGENTSEFVAKIVRDGGAIFSGSKVLLDAPLDFSVDNTISMKVYTTAPVGTPVNLKIELLNTPPAEIIMPTTVSGEWETITWDFTGTDAIYNEIVFMFDLGTVGDGSETSTFYFDDVTQSASEGSLLDQIDVPVTFEGDEINYAMTDFGGTESTLVQDPTDATNMVMQVVKPLGAADWAGTTISTPLGFASVLPLTLTESEMTVRVWSPTAGTPVRLKVEDANDDTHTCETDALTTLDGEWETLVFDFTNEAAGTQTLAIGIENGWSFNMASIFFNIGTTGDMAGEQTYYFDDVMLATTDNVNNLDLSNVMAYPNPSTDEWILTAEKTNILSVSVSDAAGKLISNLEVNAPRVTIDAASLESGIYTATLVTTHGTGTIRLVKE